MSFKQDLQDILAIHITDEQLALFNKYYNKLIEYNKHTNLTTITEEIDVYYKHFFDSLTINEYIKKDSSLCDMGSGAGFPSIPLKILNKDLKVTIVDSSNKRIKFLNELIELLELENVETIHERIEVYGMNNQLKFDYVTARALGSLNLILEYAVPMLKLSGEFIAMKGTKSNEELLSSKNAFDTLKAKVVSNKQIFLPFDYGERNILIIKKDKHIAGYPRSYQQIIKKPL